MEITISDAIKYIGCDDKTIDLFEMIANQTKETIETL
jgi:hypothetical protein